MRHVKKTLLAGLWFASISLNSAGAGGAVQDCTEVALRAAMAGGGAVTFACDGTIVLSATITASTDVALDGAGHQVTISGGNAVRVFYVSSNVTFGAANLTIANGMDAGCGAAIFNAGGAVCLLNALIQSNSVTGGDDLITSHSVDNWSSLSGGLLAEGGGVFNWGGSVSATNCTFSGNLAGILSDDVALLRGGALANEGGQVILQNCLFSGNCASYTNQVLNQGNNGTSFLESCGGAIHNNGVLSANLCAFQQNSANGASGNGGAICNFGLLAVNGGTFASNSVSGAPGAPGSTTFIPVNVPPSGNPGGSGNGGALFNAGAATLADTAFVGNQGVGGAGGEGGYIQEWVGNGEGFVGPGPGGDGGCGFGAICDIGASCYLTNCTFAKNAGIGGAGGYGGQWPQGSLGSHVSDLSSISATLTNTKACCSWAASQGPGAAAGFSILHHLGEFGRYAASFSPLAVPTLGPDGALYGTAYPESYEGTVLFTLNTNGTASSFRDLSYILPSGGWPGLVLSGTTLYGADYGAGGGLFAINTDGTGLSLLAYPGDNPWALLLSGTTLYGTLDSGDGAVFSVETNGSGGTVLHTFGTSPNDGRYPGFGCLVLSGSTLYGTTTEGGTLGGGTVYKINTDGSGYAILQNCSTANENWPLALVASGTTLYGVAQTLAGAVICKLNTDGSGYAALKQFTDATSESRDVALAVAGSTLFGTTSSGGDYNQGTIFRINTDGTGYRVLWNFSGPDGISPNGVVLSGSVLYGTTMYGGFYGGASVGGTVFSLAHPQPALTLGLESQTVEQGGDVQFCVAATGSGPLTYQWFFNGTNVIAGATGPSLELANAQFSQAGLYTVVVTDTDEASASSVAQLGVIALVPRSPAAALTMVGQPGAWLNVDYTDAFGPTPDWLTCAGLTLSASAQTFFDFGAPAPAHRFYRAWQTNGVPPQPLAPPQIGTVITLSGTPGSLVRVDYINQFGPINAWAPLATVTLTNTAQPYFDATLSFQPRRLYRVVPLP
jgi:uncharacterized repeat protein (TIGR03803 family)